MRISGSSPGLILLDPSLKIDLKIEQKEGDLKIEQRIMSTQISIFSLI